MNLCPHYNCCHWHLNTMKYLFSKENKETAKKKQEETIDLLNMLISLLNEKFSLFQLYICFCQWIVSFFVFSTAVIINRIQLVAVSTNYSYIEYHALHRYESVTQNFHFRFNEFVVCSILFFNFYHEIFFFSFSFNCFLI